MRRYLPAIIAIGSFVLGCAVAPLVVPPLSAQQSQAPRWEYYCFEVSIWRDITPAANLKGAEGWEMVGSGGDGSVWCFKRPM